MQRMITVSALAREVMDLVGRFIRVGVSGDEIDCIVNAACLDRCLYPSFLNYEGFPKSVCISVNEVMCHGVPDCRPLADGDIVTVDLGVFLKGLMGHKPSIQRKRPSSACGTPRRELSHALVYAAYEATLTGAAMVRPGVAYKELGATLYSAAARRGCSVAPSYSEHGVGRLFHAPPDVPYCKKGKPVGVMKPGHVFTLGPLVNAGTGGDVMWPDDWTLVTKDGRRSAKFSHTVLVTETGYEILTLGKDSSGMFPAFCDVDYQR